MMSGILNVIYIEMSWWTLQSVSDCLEIPKLKFQKKWGIPKNTEVLKNGQFFGWFGAAQIIFSETSSSIWIISCMHHCFSGSTTIENQRKKTVANITIIYIYNYIYLYNTTIDQLLFKNCWLVVEPYPSEKWWSSSVGMMKFPIYGKS